MLNTTQARDKAEALVEQAIRAGASAADAIYLGERSTGVQVRCGALEDVHSAEGEELGLRLFVGQRSASVATSDLSDEALAVLVERALAMAGEAPEDPFAGLAPSDALLRDAPADLDSADSQEPAADALRARALAAEGAALAVPGITNSAGAGANASVSIIALATSGGFAGAYRTTGHGCSVSVVAGESGRMQRDYAYRTARHLGDLEAAETIGRRAGTRAVARLDPIRIKAGRMAVLFDPRVAASLLGHFSAAINGASVARRSSFLMDRLGEPIFAPGVTITDDPLRRRGLRSRPFDGEGLPVARIDIVADGVLTSWFADSAAARQLGIRPTGHAVRGGSGAPGAGPSNLFLHPGARSREQLLAAAGEAILLTELIGQGVNPITGDYSRGAAGFLVRSGEIGPAVAEITIAANLVDMFRTLEPAADLELLRGIDAPTILVPEMTVASA